MKTIKVYSSGKVEEKRSKFIADMFHVETIEEAETRLEEIKKKYFDAKHHCYAYRIQTEDGIIERSSDDGEPSGTAGGPILNILQKQDIGNVIVIVTRYFGGVLLGTGGLVKAYSDATQNVIENSEFVTQVPGTLVSIKLKYDEIQQFKYFIEKNNIKITKEEYLEDVIFELEVQDIKILQDYNYTVIENKNIFI